MNENFWINLILVGMVSINLVSADSNPIQLNLQDLIEQVLNNNPEIHAMQQRYKAAKYKAMQAGVWDDPELGVEFEGMSRNTLDWGRYQDIEWSFSQKIPFPGKSGLKRKVAEQEVQKTYQEYLEKKLEIMSRMKMAYADFCWGDQSLVILQKHEDLLKQFLDIARQKYELGKASGQDVLKAQVELAKVKNRFLIQKQTQISIQAKLNAILAHTQNQVFQKPQVQSVEKMSLDEDALMDLALDHSPLLKNEQFNIRASLYELKLAQREYWPNFFTKLEARQFEGEGLEEYDVMFGINIPWLWSRARVSGAIQEAKANLKKAKSEYDAKRLEVFLSIREGVVKVKTAQSLVDLYRLEILPSAEQVVQLAQVNYQTDKIDFLMLLDSQRSLLEFQLEYEQAIADYHKNRAELEKSVGKEFRRNDQSSNHNNQINRQ